MSDDKMIGIYLNDHLAGAVAAIELARRSLRSNRQSGLGAFLASLIQELEEDRAAMLDVMRRLGVRPSTVKVVGGWVAEKVGRLKLNGQLLGYSDLSRLEELEALALGVEGKIAGWKTLSTLAQSDARLVGVDFDVLKKRAQAQRTSLERHRITAARRAFGI
jgi:hypothetical protein